jgi:hypothetical protein
MYCAECGASYDLHDFILKFDEVWTVYLTLRRSTTRPQDMLMPTGTIWRTRAAPPTLPSGRAICSFPASAARPTPGPIPSTKICKRGCKTVYCLDEILIVFVGNQGCDLVESSVH